MVKVCAKEFPKTEGFFIDEWLKQNLDILIKNIKHDWDFTIIISGGGEVRVGKSVLGMQIGAYIISEINRLYGKNYKLDLKKHFCWNGQELIEKGENLKKEPYSPLIYDEAGSELQSKKIMTTMTKQVLDYFRECGQYNLFNILVIPDFFDLPKGIAITRSIFLLDIYYTTKESGTFERGYFKFFNAKKKKQLYIQGKRDLNYDVVRSNFVGRFPKFYPINEGEYRELKLKAMAQRAKLTTREMRNRYHLKAAVNYMHQEGMTLHEIAKFLTDYSHIRINYTTIAEIIDKEPLEFENK